MTETETRHLARIVCQPLFAAWGGAALRGRPLSLDGELTRIGLFAEDAGVVAAAAVSPVSAAHATHEYATAARLGRQCLALLDGANQTAPFHLLRHTALACRVIGEADHAADLLERTVAATKGQDSVEAAQALAEYGELLVGRGDIDTAEQHLIESVHLFIKHREILQTAVAQGRLADIFYSRGQLDEALAIRQDKQLPVFQKLGDVRSAAITHGQIADIFYSRGQLDEALAIRQDKQLPVFQKLGDVRSAAITHGQIADIFYSRGQLDEALDIRQKQELPVYQKLGDVQSMIVCRTNIAINLIQRGRPEDVQPVLEHLMWAYTAAKERGYREAAQIEGILRQWMGSAGAPPP